MKWAQNNTRGTQPSATVGVIDYEKGEMSLVWGQTRKTFQKILDLI